MFYQLVSVLGAVLILVAYAANQRGWLGRDNMSYHILNIVGSGLLAWIAILDRRLGFIFLESAWALLSVPGLISTARRRSRRAADS